MEVNKINRQIHKTAGGSYILTLPKTWCENAKIDENVQFTIFKTSNGFIITQESSPNKSPLSFKIDLDHLEFPYNIEYLKQILIAGYIAGYQSIVLSTKSEKKINHHYQIAVDWFKKRTSWSSQTKKGSEIILFNLDSDAQGNPVENDIKMMHLVVRRFLSEIFVAIKKKDAEGFQLSLEELQLRDDDIDREYQLIFRNTSTLLSSDFISDFAHSNEIEDAPSLMLQNYLVSRSLEKVSDYVVKLSPNILDIIKFINANPSESVEELHKSLINLLDDSLEIIDASVDAYFLTYSIKKSNQKPRYAQEAALRRSHKVCEKIRLYQNSCDSLIKSNNRFFENDRNVINFENILLNLVLSIHYLKAIGDLSADISKATINKVITGERESDR
jgi:phosphate uptake regulator